MAARLALPHKLDAVRLIGRDDTSGEHGLAQKVLLYVIPTVRVSEDDRALRGESGINLLASATDSKRGLANEARQMD